MGLLGHARRGDLLHRKAFPSHGGLEAVLPGWAHEGGKAATLERLGHGPTRKLKQESEMIK